MVRRRRWSAVSPPVLGSNTSTSPGGTVMSGPRLVGQVVEQRDEGTERRAGAVLLAAQDDGPGVRQRWAALRFPQQAGLADAGFADDDHGLG